MRYGLNRSKHIAATSILALALLVLSVPVVAPPSHAQGTTSWWGSTTWFDWSDFRAENTFRLVLPRLVSGKLDYRGMEYQLKEDLGMTDDPEPFGEYRWTVYIDRLGFRYWFEEDHQFFGNAPTAPANAPRISLLDLGTSRVGLDLDIVRYPVFRLGINGDYQLSQAKLLLFKEGNAATALVSGGEPITLGLHVTAIPIRIRDVPFVVNARGRVPLPFLNRTRETHVYDWEVSAGLRPAVWDMSLYRHSTIAVGIEGGFRSVYVNVDMDDVNAHLKTHWQGGFFQVGFYF
jgi:hypothetical protein